MSASFSVDAGASARVGVAREDDLAGGEVDRDRARARVVDVRDGERAGEPRRERRALPRVRVRRPAASATASASSEGEQGTAHAGEDRSASALGLARAKIVRAAHGGQGGRLA